MRTKNKISAKELNRILSAKVQREYSLDSKGKGLLNEEGIFVQQFPSVLKTFEVTALKEIYCGIGIRNKKGGVEFYSSSLSCTPITVKRAGVTYIPREDGRRSDNCCLFSDFMDYLAFLSLRDRHPLSLPDCDCLIMSAISNFMQMLHDCKKYDRVYCFFPNTVYGKTLFLTVSGSVKRVAAIKDYSDLYKDMPCMLQYIKSLEENGNKR